MYMYKTILYFRKHPRWNTNELGIWKPHSMSRYYKTLKGASNGFFVSESLAGVPYKSALYKKSKKGKYILISEKIFR